MLVQTSYTAPNFEGGFMEDATISYVKYLLESYPNGIQSMTIRKTNGKSDIVVVSTGDLKNLYKPPANVHLTVVPHSVFEEYIKNTGL